MSTPARHASATDGILWTPPPERAARSHLARFMRFAAARVPAAPPGTFGDFRSLHRWSVADPASFWGLCAEFAGLRFGTQPRAVVEDLDRMPGARWFPGATLDVAGHFLRAAGDGGEAPALIWRTEAGGGVLSWRDLASEVARVAAGLRALGVGPGTRVAGLLPNGPEAIIAFLATASAGGTWSSCSPDFGVPGVLDRFAPLAPRVLFAAAGYRYGGKAFPLTGTLAEVVAGLPSLGKVVVTPFEGRLPDVPGAEPWEHFGAGLPASPSLVLPFEHPLLVLFSSGTTGKPKRIVHSAGGVLVQHLKEHLLHGDLHRGDRLFYYTTCGWMMWNWMVTGLAAGATLVLYEGSPTAPDPGVLWRLAEEARITHFGANPRYLAALARSGYRPGERHDLKALRTVFSTGAPLGPEGFDFVYDAIKADVQLASISGGTDLVSCFALGNPLEPVRRGEMQGPALGLAVGVHDASGRPMSSGTGELVCTRPFPTVPLGFDGDTDGQRFHQAYFARFPGTWAHGDWAEWTAAGGLVIHGRSDATLNPGGVRIGTAELYRALAAVPEVTEAVAVDQRWQGETRIVLAVVLRNGERLDDALAARIRARIRADLTPRHVPSVLFAVPEIPRTRSGKASELAVRAAIHGEEAGNDTALENPHALAHFRNRPELET